MYPASVCRGQFVAGLGFGIGELARKWDMRDAVGAVWLLVKALSAQGEQAWQRMIGGWIASRLVRGLFIVFPNSAMACPSSCAFGVPRCKLTVLVWWWCLTNCSPSVCKRVTYPCEGLLLQVVGLDIWTSKSQFRRRCRTDSCTHTFQETDAPAPLELTPSPRHSQPTVLGWGQQRINVTTSLFVIADCSLPARLICQSSSFRPLRESTSRSHATSSLSGDLPN